MRIEYIFNSLEEFYASVENCITEQGRDSYNNYKYFDDSISPYFVGLTAKDVHKYKYSYTKGLNKLQKLDDLLILGGKQFINKYSDLDGIDMNFERYVENMPYLIQKVRTTGKNKGKFITIWVNISINSNIDADQCLYKAYTVMALLNYLENEGYRIRIIIYDDAYSVGLYQHELVDVSIKINIKDFNDPLIPGRILTAISPWMERYWIFKFNLSKFEETKDYGFGKAADYTRKLDDNENIYFSNTTALNETLAKKKIESLQRLFDLSKGLA